VEQLSRSIWHVIGLVCEKQGQPGGNVQIFGGMAPRAPDRNATEWDVRQWCWCICRQRSSSQVFAGTSRLCTRTSSTPPTSWGGLHPRRQSWRQTCVVCLALNVTHTQTSACFSVCLSRPVYRRWGTPHNHVLVDDNNQTTRSQRSQECKSPRRQCFCDSLPWPLTFWPQNIWIPRTHRGTFHVKFGDPSCIGFWDIVRKKTDKQG